MGTRALFLTAFLFSPFAGLAQELVSFPTEDGGTIFGNLSGEGTHGVLLAHGGRFNKESWRDQARRIASAGFRVLAIDFRGYGESTGPGDTDAMSAPLHLDVLGGVAYLRNTGSSEVSVIGASMGGWAAADAAIIAGPGVIDRLVILAAPFQGKPENLFGRKLFIIAGGDATAQGTPRLVRLRELYDRVPEPKELVVLDGSAHAQYLFETPVAETLLQLILRFLSAP